MKRLATVGCLVGLVAIVGCGSANDPGSSNVLFNQIEGGVQDMETNVASKFYSGDLGEDRLGPALTNFQKSVAGTPVAADVDKMIKKFTEVSTLGSKRPKKDVLLKAVKELSTMVAEIKKKL